MLPRGGLYRETVVPPEQEQDRQRVGGFDILHLDHFPRRIGHFGLDTPFEQDDKPVCRFVLQSENLAFLEAVFMNVQFIEDSFELIGRYLPKQGDVGQCRIVHSSLLSVRMRR